MPKRSRSYTHRPNKRARTSKATKALNLAKRVYRNTKPEVKYLDTSLFDYQVPRTGTRWSVFGTNSTLLNPLKDIIQGTADSNRIGDKIRMLSLYMKYSCYIPTSSASVFSALRIMIVKIKLPNDASLSTSDVYFDTGVDPMIARRNIDTTAVVKVLYDRVHRMAKNQTSQNQYHNGYVRLRDEVVFENATPATQKIVKNAYFVVAYSTDSVTANQPRLSINMRAAYTDV